MTPRPLHRILMTGDTVGGVWTFTLDLARALTGRGIQVVLATFGGLPNEAQRTEAARIAGLRFHPTSYKLEWMEDPWRDVEESGRWLLNHARRCAPDLVHLNSFGHGALPWRFPVLLTAHSCVASWWEAVKREPLPASWHRYYSTVAASLKAADLITAPSHAMLESLPRHYGPGLPPCRAIHNGRDATPFRAAPKEPFIFTAGRLWDEAKNVAALAGIAHLLAWPVAVAGDGAAAAPNCRLLGHLDSAELAGWYARASIYALPARYEPFGLTALEAALCGCALVLGDIPSLREIWADAAIFVSPDDPGALRGALHSLIEDPSLLREMSARALARASEYTVDRTASQYLDAYQTVAAHRRIACAS